MDISGIVLIDKPIFKSSHDIVNEVRRIFKTKRVGHTGTLDPLATGVLPVLIGNATKASDMLVCDNKEYVAEAVLGMTTDTGDCEGEVLTDCGVCLTEEEIKAAIESFRGDYYQIPPMYSAKKKDGKKMYDLARAGITIDREPVKVEIFDIEAVSIDIENYVVTFRVNCSKGTYIRTLCEDIGLCLGAGAYMNKLRRTKSGLFAEADCVMLEELRSNPERYVLPIDSVFDYDKIYLSEKQAEHFKNGVFVSHNEISNGETYRIYDQSGKFLALAVCKDGRLRIKKSLWC